MEAAVGSYSHTIISPTSLFSYRLFQNQFTLQILPVISTEGFVSTLKEFFDGSKVASCCCTDTEKPDPLMDLVPYCTAAPSMSRHTAKVLGEVCLSFRDLVEHIQSDQGIKYLTRALGYQEVSSLLSFWKRAI